jgi:diacylglycerol kinase (ATP)
MRVIHNRYYINKKVSPQKAGILTFTYIVSLKNRLKMTDFPKQKKTSIFYQLKTFQYALRGIRIFFKGETKSKIHLLAAIVSITFGVVLNVSPAEWIMISFAIGIVFVCEIFNTAIELIVDQISLERTEHAGIIKDLAAAAVLFASFTAL